MEVLIRDSKLWSSSRRLFHMKKSKNSLWILLPEEHIAATSSFILRNNSTMNRDNHRPFLNSNHKFRYYQIPPHRGMGMIVVKLLRGVLKIRYLVIGSAIGGGLSLQNAYQQWVDALPDLSWMDKYIPKNDDWKVIRTSMLSLRDKLKELELDPQLREKAESNLQSLRDWFDTRLEAAKKAAEQDTVSYEKDRAGEIINNAVTVNALSYERDNEDAPHFSEKEIWDLKIKYQQEIDRLEKENKELRQQILLRGFSSSAVKRVQTSVIDMYSDVLDELSDYDMNYQTQDHMPRVIVIGDQSSGKTSVLEMIAQARIFPRGAGEMMTRAPVKVTLSEGPYHIAQFKDSPREYDLTKESDLDDLRKGVEIRMKNLTSDNGGVSNEVISMTVKGPGLPRMVLVDLPGIISTNTLGMNPETKENIYQIAKYFMSNPNAIILCIQDGSVDAERSNVTDLVSQMDPTGKRTIFVLTKVDLAEENFANPDRIRKILAGELFPMKALGYFAVVTGRGSQNESIAKIKEYEEKFFRNSKIFYGKNVKSTQITTKNLSLAVSQCFWKTVQESVEQQADAFKARRFNLETEWKNNYPGQRVLDRMELFDKGRTEILDLVINLCEVNVKDWEDKLASNLWDKVNDFVFENIYFNNVIYSKNGEINTKIDINLFQWTENELPKLSVEVGWVTLKEELKKLLFRRKNPKEHDMFYKLKEAILEEAVKRHKWEDKAIDVLRLLQNNTLSDRGIAEKNEWESAVRFLESSFKQKLKEVENVMKEKFGPGYWEQWYLWKYKTEEQKTRSQVKNELDKLLLFDAEHSPSLSQDEIITVKKTLSRTKIVCDDSLINDIWNILYRKHIISSVLQKIPYYSKGFFLYRQGIDVQEYNEVLLYWRIKQMLKVTVNSLRQQIVNREAARLDEEIQEILEDFSRSKKKIEEFLTGRRIEIAEELKRVKQIQEKLEIFIKALNKDKVEARRLH